MIGKDKSKMGARIKTEAIIMVNTAKILPIWGFFHKNKEVIRQ